MSLDCRVAGIDAQYVVGFEERTIKDLLALDDGDDGYAVSAGRSHLAVHVDAYEMTGPRCASFALAVREARTPVAPTNPLFQSEKLFAANVRAGCPAPKPSRAASEKTKIPTAAAE
jgi:hypothetical protein